MEENDVVATMENNNTQGAEGGEDHEDEGTGEKGAGVYILVQVLLPSSTLMTFGDSTMMQSLIQGLDLSSIHKCSNNFVFRFSADLDRMKKGGGGTEEAQGEHRRWD